MPSSMQPSCDMRSRFRLIEIFATWEGRINCKHLQQAFEVSRPTALKNIEAYCHYAPGNLVYDKHAKAYLPTRDFKPHYTKGNVEEYLYIIAEDQRIENFQTQTLRAPNTLAVMPLQRNIKQEILQKVIQACREQRRLEIEYTSIENPNKETRVIQPHTLVFNGYRWHIRAWCEKNKSFCDFVLTRLFDQPELLTEATHTQERDVLWQTPITIHLIADTRLSKAQQKLVALDYGFIKNRLTIKTRAALVTYYLQLLRLYPYDPQRSPEKQQIIVANWDEIEAWVW